MFNKRTRCRVSVSALKLDSVISTLFSLNLALKSTHGITEKVADAATAASDLQRCWRCVCLSTRQCTTTSRSWHMVELLCRVTSHSLIVWSANITDLNPVDYHIFWRYFPEIQVAIQHNYRLFSKLSTFSGKQYNFDQMKSSALRWHFSGVVKNA